MPLYKFKCTNKACRRTFEKLVSMSVRDKQGCPSCKEDAIRDGFSGFTVNTPLDLSTKSPHTKKEIDRVVGDDANSKWEAFHKKTAAKIKKAEDSEDGKIVELDIKPGEKFNPETLLGDEDRRKRSEIYSEAVVDRQEAVTASGGDPKAWDKTGFRKVNI